MRLLKSQNTQDEEHFRQGLCSGGGVCADPDPWHDVALGREGVNDALGLALAHFA